MSNLNDFHPKARAVRADYLIPRGEVAYEDGLTVKKVAVATYDFAEHGGAVSAIGLGVYLPDNAIITRAWYDVVTTVTTASTDTGTLAVHVQSANDIVSAVAVNDGGNPWDSGLHDAIPDTTAATSIKLTAEREITVTIGTAAVTAGKIVFFVEYVISA